MYQRLSVDILVLVTLITSIVNVTVAAEDSWLGPEFGVIQKVYDDCSSKNDFTGCLKGKALGAISKAVDQDSVSLLDGISFVKQSNATAVEDAPEIIEPKMLNGLSAIDASLLKKLDTFFKTHTLKFDLGEGRGDGGGFGGGHGGGFGGGGGGGNKKGGKKMNRYVIAALLTAMGIAGPLGLKALAAIAGKALVISKVALTIAGIIALKKIFSSDHHEETSFQVHAGGHDNRRNTYSVRPVKAAAPAADPYKYYYESQYPSQYKPY